MYQHLQQTVRLTDVLNCQLQDRIRHLVFLLETAPIKDLSAFYPILVNHIFGNNENTGWGLRCVTEKNFNEFRILYDFLNPHSAFFHLIHRLLKDTTTKYDLKISELPRPARQMLESGRYSNFYASLLNVENFQPRNFSLSLNAFDFYIYQFCLHGMKNYHKVSAAALAVNNENSKTVYFNLAADYLCHFLPSDPNAQIFPQIDSSPLKLHQTMPIQNMGNPTKPTKYLKLSALHHQIQSPSNARADIRMADVKNSNWRSESVMIIFIDTWLRYDVDESWELPGNEFIRLIRILVKQLHFFANVADQDISSLSALRHQAQSSLNLRIYPFLKTIISRWPLDTSFLNVLELFLSYIQPWRYIYNRNVQHLNNDLIDIPDRFKIFISENIVVYTQTYVRLIPRFLKMDLALNKNAFMLFRMMKVYRQLTDVLRDIERQMMNNNSTTIRSHASLNDSSTQQSPRTPNSFNRSAGERSPHHHHYRSLNQTAIEDISYVLMFSEEVTMQVYELMQRLFMAKLKTGRDVYKMEKEMHKHSSIWEKFLQFIGWLSSLSLSFSMALEEKKRTPVYIEFCLNVMSTSYNIQIEDVTKDFEQNESLAEESDNDNVSAVGSDFLNITPSFMKQRLQNIKYTGDPFLIPIMNHEVKFLVRFLHQVSSKINEMFENEFASLYSRSDFCGKFMRQILSGPVETRVFDKTAGYSQLKVEHLGPRLSLRRLASRKIIFLFVMSLLVGRLLFGASVGVAFITFIFVAVVVVMIKALMS